MNNILVTGSSGQLGSEIKINSNYISNSNMFFTDSHSLDITKYEKVKNFIIKNRIKSIINCAAYTDVDNAEIEPNLANEINHLAVSNLARLAKELDLKLIHISTDYVFDGLSKTPYKESDIPKPVSVYGQTKLDGELAILNINPLNSIIIRTSWLYSRNSNSFVNKIISSAENKNEINVVDDQIGSPTYAKDLAKVIINILPLINSKVVEIYHYSNLGSCSRFEFAREILKIKNIKISLKPTKSYINKGIANRPKYSNLDKSKIINKYGLKIPEWTTSLYDALN